VPVGKGLALYFWLRLGYRPGDRGDRARTTTGSGPGASEDDNMIMVRELG
jgi:hypothetical protein